MDRLHSPEPPDHPAGWQRLGLDLESKPVLVCACGVLVCVLLLIGLIASLRVEPPNPAPPAPGDKAHMVVVPPLNASGVPAPQIGPTVSAEPLPHIGDPVVVSAPLPFKPVYFP